MYKHGYTQCSAVCQLPVLFVFSPSIVLHVQAEVISSDTVPQKSAESGAALATMAASASADVDQVLDGLTSTAVTEQQPAAAGTDTEETLSASLPQDANQQQARVTADVDEAVAQVISSVEQPEAIVPSGSAESAGREAEEDWQPATANDVATAEQQQFRVTGDVDQTLTDLTSSLEIPAAESDFTEVQAANVARDSSQHTTPDAYGAVGADSSNPQDVAMLETHSGAEGNEQQGTLPDAAAAVNTDTGSEQPTIDEANAEQPQIDNLQRNPEHLSGDIDQLLADLMPAMPDQASAAKSQQQLSAAEHSSSAVEGLASQPAAETLPTDGMTNEGARVQQVMAVTQSIVLPVLPVCLSVGLFVLRLLVCLSVSANASRPAC